MKKTFYLLFLLTFLYGCKNDPIEQPKFADKDFNTSKFANTAPPQIDIKALIKSEVENFAESPIYSQPEPLTEVSARNLLDPMVENSYLLLKNEYNFTDTQLIDIFGSTSNEEITGAGLAIDIFNVIPKEYFSTHLICNTSNKYIKCAYEAFMPCELISWMYNEMGNSIRDFGFKAAFNNLPYSSKKYILQQVSKHTIRRISGFIGLAITIYDLNKCLNENSYPILDDEDGEPGTGSGGNSEIDLPGVGVTMYSYGESLDRITNIINQYEPAFTTVIYNNSGIYFYNSNYTCQLPNGYYTHDNYNVYEVNNGIVINKITVSQCLTCPGALLPPLVYPFGGCLPNLN